MDRFFNPGFSGQGEEMNGHSGINNNNNTLSNNNNNINNNHNGQNSANFIGTQQYTLPGVMQYLQSQFTIIEKNRMMNDLEKSSLKLKIIELESERNILKMTNEKLNLKVAELERRLGSLTTSSGNDTSSNPTSSSNENESKGFVSSLSRSGSKHFKKNNNNNNNNNNNDGNVRVSPPAPSASAVNNPSTIESSASLESIQLAKLVNARKFLKTTTNEILYLLKSPSVELNDPLNLTKEDAFFVDPNTVMNHQSQAFRDSTLPTSSYSALESLHKNDPQPRNNSDYEDVSVALEPGFNSAVYQKKSNQSLNDSNSYKSDVESDAETVVDEPLNGFKPKSTTSNGKAELSSIAKSSQSPSKHEKSATSVTPKKKLLMRDNKHKSSNSIATEISHLDLEGKLKQFQFFKDNLYCLFHDSIKVFANDLSTLKASVPLSQGTANMNVTITDELVIVTMSKQLKIYSNNISTSNSLSLLVSYKLEEEIKDVDYNSITKKLLVTLPRSINIFKLNSEESELSPLMNTDLGMNIYKAKFINNKDGYNVAIVTEKCLLLRKLGDFKGLQDPGNNDDDDNDHSKKVNLDEFQSGSFILTSHYLIIKISNDLLSLNLFHGESFETIKSSIGHIDDLTYYVDNKDSFSFATSTLKNNELSVSIFKSAKPGSVSYSKTIAIEKNHSKDVTSHICLGSYENKPIIGYLSDNKIEFYDAE